MVWFTEEAIAAWRAASAAYDPGRAALVLAPGDPDGADTAHRVPPGAAPDRRADRLHPPPARARARSRRAGPRHAQPPGRNPGGAASSVQHNPGSGPVYLLVDSTGLKLGGPGAWLTEKHGTKIRRSWRKLHLGVDAATGAITAAEPTSNDVDDGSQVGPLLDQVEGAAVAWFTGDGADDREDVDAAAAERHPEAAAVVAPPRSSAVARGTTATAPTQRDQHLELIAERGRTGWQ